MGIAYIFVAPAIKKASPGPAFFKQERVGKTDVYFTSTNSDLCIWMQKNAKRTYGTEPDERAYVQDGK